MKLNRYEAAAALLIGLAIAAACLTIFAGLAWLVVWVIMHVPYVKPIMIAVLVVVLIAVVVDEHDNT